MVAGARCLVCWSGWLLATLSAAPVAWAAEPSRSVGSPEISWDAPRGCPDAESVARRLVHALEGAPAELGAGWQVHGRITGGQSGPWQLALTLAAPDAGQDTPANVRVLSAKQCDDLGDAAAVAIAIALGDAASFDAAPSEDTGDAPLAPLPSTGLHAPALDIEPALTSPADGARAPRRLALGAELVLDSATLGGLVGGAAVEAQGSLGRLGLGLYGLWLPPSSHGIGTRQSAELSLLVGGLRACYSVPADWLLVAACVGGEVGALDAQVEGLRDGRDQSDLWLAPGAGVGFGGKLVAGVGLRSRVEVLFPILRQQYRVDLEQAIHSVPEATLRWSLGLEADILVR